MKEPSLSALTLGEGLMLLIVLTSIAFASSASAAEVKTDDGLDDDPE